MNSPHPSSGTNYIDLKTLILDPKPKEDPRNPGSDSVGIAMLFFVSLSWFKKKEAGNSSCCMDRTIKANFYPESRTYFTLLECSSTKPETLKRPEYCPECVMRMISEGHPTLDARVGRSPTPLEYYLS